MAPVCGILEKFSAGMSYQIVKVALLLVATAMVGVTIDRTSSKAHADNPTARKGE